MLSRPHGTHASGRYIETREQYIVWQSLATGPVLKYTTRSSSCLDMTRFVLYRVKGHCHLKSSRKLIKGAAVYISI